MLFIILLVLGVGASVLLTRDTASATTDEYCRMECRERKVHDYTYCC
jgi:hypothetical protein